MKKRLKNVLFCAVLMFTVSFVDRNSMQIVSAANTSCTHTVLDATGMCQNATCGATGQNVCKLNGTSYTSLVSAFQSASDGDEIKLLKDCYDESAIIQGNASTSKNITFDLNGHTLKLYMVENQKDLTIKNGTYVGRIDNPANNGNFGLLTLVNMTVETNYLQWMSNDGVNLQNSSLTLLSGSHVWLEDLFMDEHSTFTLTNVSTGIGNYGSIASGAFSSIEEFLPSGYQVVRYDVGTASERNAIVDENGNIATTFAFKYRRLTDAEVVLNPESFVYNGKAATPSVTVKYDGVTLRENIDYTYTFKNNTNVGNAEVLITGQDAYHGTASKQFVIKKASQNAPTGLTGVDESVAGQKDGAIQNVTTDMEYSRNGKKWKKVTGDTIEGLKAGTYYVRFAEKENYLASEATEVELLALAEKAESTSTAAPSSKTTKSSDVPRTGDSSDVILWSLMAMVSMLGVISAISRKKDMEF